MKIKLSLASFLGVLTMNLLSAAHALAIPLDEIRISPNQSIEFRLSNGTNTRVSCSSDSTGGGTVVDFSVGGYAIDSANKVVRVNAVYVNTLDVTYIFGGSGNFIYNRNLFSPEVLKLNYIALRDGRTYSIQEGDQLVDSVNKIVRVKKVFKNGLIWVDYVKGGSGQYVFSANLFTR